jgi:hypothetical protein
MANLTYGGTPGVNPMDPFAYTGMMTDYNTMLGSPAGAASTVTRAATGAATAPVAASGMATTVNPVAPEVNAPGGGQGGFLQGLGGWNLDTAKLALGGIQTLGNILMGARALKMARDQFNYQKGVSETNLVNSIQAYNTALEDRARNRADAMNQDEATTQAYIDENKAVRV